MSSRDRPAGPADVVPPVAARHDVVVERWVYGGEGLARIDGGRVVLVPFVLPGERVSVEDTGAVHASFVEVVDAAPARREPPCPVFAVCGGCHYQHAPYEMQLAGKVEILREQLRRVGKITFDGDVAVLSGPPLGYRNRVQLHVRHGQIGYRAPRSHDLVSIDTGCPIASPRLNEAIAAMQDRVARPRFPRGVRSLELFTNETALQIWVTDPARTGPRPVRWEWESVDAIEYPTAYGGFRVSARSFFQVNRFLIDQLVAAALAGHSGEHALDLYAGGGLFSVALSRRFATVTAVESAASAARDLSFNVRGDRTAGAVKVVRGATASFLGQLDRTPDLVLADPPRRGLGGRVTAELERLAPPRLVLVSCDPSTLARDLAALPSYRIETLTLIDLFPQTYHLETIVHLARIT